MKTIKWVLATTLVLAIIGAPPVSCCDWGFCDREYVDNANSLLGLTCDWDKCFRSLERELGALCNLYGPTCGDPSSDCGQRFRQDVKELFRILYSVPRGPRKFSPEVKDICRLICKRSARWTCCHPDYLKDARKLMKLMSLKQGSITLLGTFKATKEGHKGVASNRLLDTLGRSSYNRYITLRMALATGQLIKAAERSNTSLLMLASAMGNLKVAEELLANGKNVNAQNKTGKTALMFAAFEGHPEVVETLLKAGADPNLKDKDGATAANLAKKNGHYDVVKILEKPSVKKKIEKEVNG